MGNEWIIDVLEDLKTFARMNGLDTLASQLDDTAEVARIEIESTMTGAPLSVVGDGTKFGRLPAQTGTGHRA
ncbi:hypothetical protein EU803_01250 [Loktanella sp. IMCC34160]|uniref:hypothetical protein n=1 Tax=Loktanella sp. IMCC34160 TaxID=2510646 RepID=UPI00101CBC81|nr:hypothetical protein [Loktanella sp. IMCC34160]RYG92763.1 hypothetical protein EU803_01250 [Loktanella sp. IMCC34160]